MKTYKKILNSLNSSLNNLKPLYNREQTAFSFEYTYLEDYFIFI